MARTSPMISASPPPVVTTETFQQHYGRGGGYHPPSMQNFHPSPYAPPSGSGYHHPSQHLPPPYQGHGGCQASSYPTPPWHYPPQNNNPIPVPIAPPRGIASASTTSLRNASNNLNHVPPSLVTPKSHDSETIPPVAVGATATTTSPAQLQKPAAKSTSKRIAKSKKKDSDTKSPAVNDEKDPEMEVEPMKQDFHFYAVDHYNEVNQTCQRQLNTAYADGSIAETNKENHLFLLTTLINARLIKNWEDSPPSTRAHYLKKEEADRKRFMSEEEVASRHCATLTARKRSPKQSGVERAESFGLTSSMEDPMVTTSSRGGAAAPRAGEKRKSDDAGLDTNESSSKISKGEI